MAAARLLNPFLRSLPIQHGMVRVGGATADPESGSDAHDALIDDRGELSVVLMTRQSGTEAASVHAALAVMRDALAAHAPIYEVLAVLRAWCSRPEHQAVMGITLLRFAQPDSRVEILTAGTPPVVCAAPGGHTGVHGPLSGAVGARAGEVHPYELSPLTWGSVWIVMSAGLTAGSLDPELARQRVLRTQLAQRGPALSGASSDELRSLLPQVALDGVGQDGSVLVVHADPTRRFVSGIR